jgi:hypothetical protein
LGTIKIFPFFVLETNLIGERTLFEMVWWVCFERREGGLVENEVDFLFISNLVLLIYSITIIFVIYYLRNIVLKKLRWEE